MYTMSYAYMSIDHIPVCLHQQQSSSATTDVSTFVLQIRHTYYTWYANLLGTSIEDFEFETLRKEVHIVIVYLCITPVFTVLLFKTCQLLLERGL